jgi:hypothetical protein
MNQEEIINEAKAALKKSPFGDFDAQVPHLICLLEHLYLPQSYHDDGNLSRLVQAKCRPLD